MHWLRKRGREREGREVTKGGRRRAKGREGEGEGGRGRERERKRERERDKKRNTMSEGNNR